MPRPNEDIALVDLDGTLADYDKRMLEDLNKLRGPEEEELMQLDHGGLSPHVEARRRVIKNQPGWWQDLPWTKHGRVLLNLANEADFHVHILTQGPETTPAAWTEKLIWVQKHIFPDDISISITRRPDGEAKGMVYGKVLFDDYVPFIESWLKWRPRGLVIMPAHHHNEEFVHPNVIRFDGSDDVIEKTRVALQKAKDR